MKTPPPASATPPRILIVEDESVVARDIQQQLLELGYLPVGHSTTAEQAIILAGDLRPDLVLMDIKLAGPMDGIAAAHAIREQFGLPVVFLTAFAENETLAQAKRSEPFGYVLKPFSERELHTVIQMALYRHSVETRLRDSEAQFRALFDTSLDGMMLTAADGRIFSANRAACTILGRTETEICRIGRAGLVAPDDPRLAGYLAERARTGMTRGEVTMVRPDGSRFDVEFSSANFQAGREVRNGLAFRDITLRKRHEREIERLNRIYLVLSEVNRAIVQAKSQVELFERICRVLTQSGPFMIAWIGLHDLDAQLLVPIAVANDKFGYAHAISVSTAPTQTTGGGPSGTAFRENRPYVCNDYLADPATLPWRELALRSGIRSALSMPLCRAGHPVAILTVYSGERDLFQDREVSLLVETANDVSFALDVLAGSAQRQAVEGTLRLHSAALNAAADAIFITDRTGLIEWANPAFAELCRWPVDEIIGKNPRDLLKSGEHDAAFYHELWATILGGHVWRGEIINRRRDGVLRTEHMTVTPLRDAHGTITHFIAIKQDITDRKAMETHFLKAQRMEAIGALAGGVAHDLNNILAPIMMVTGVLREKLTDADDRELLGMAQSSTQRGADIVKQLLTFSRGQEGERTLVQPRHLLGEMITMMRETFPRNLDLKQLLPGTMWTIQADPTQLHQVLLNLCVNARDAMPDGGRLLVSAANVTLAEGDPKLPLSAKPGPFVVISIVDSGHGIPAEIQHRIFDPFFTTKPLGKGTGLGLSTVLGIVQAHGGFIDLESHVGSGSSFHVYLPAIPDGIEASAPAPAPRTVPRATGQTILVVDDERDVRDSIRIILENEHYAVITATDGEAGLAQYLKHRARLSLVITDLMMPKMNGLTFIRTLRAIDPQAKILVTSGLTEVTERRELAELGVPEILMKPYDGPALLELVRSRLAAP